MVDEAAACHACVHVPNDSNSLTYQRHGMRTEFPSEICPMVAPLSVAKTYPTLIDHCHWEVLRGLSQEHATLGVVKKLSVLHTRGLFRFHHPASSSLIFFLGVEEKGNSSCRVPTDIACPFKIIAHREP